MLNNRLVFTAVLIALFLYAPIVAARPSLRLPKDIVTIKTSEEDVILNVELALTSQAQAQGLMYRSIMPPDYGMLFIFSRAIPIAMWMKNTRIPLDMVFIQGDGKIIRITRNTKPNSTNPIPSGKPAKAVLELNAGTTARLNIQIGDIVKNAYLAQ